MTTASEPLTIRAEPLAADPSACRFTLSQTLYSGSHLCASAADAQDSELLVALFGLSGVTQAWIANDTLTLRKSAESAPWPELGRNVGSLLRSFIAAGKRFAPPAVATGGTVRDRIEKLLREQVNPGVASHGGKIELEDFRDGQAYLRMSGGCQGCSSAKATLGQGVEKILRTHIPELQGIVDVTDHARGSSPHH